MGIFDRLSKKNPAAPTSVAKPKKSTKKADAQTTDTVSKEDKVVVPAVAGGNSWRLLLTPRVSEKAALLASKGTYVFNVPLSANKVEIRKAIESLYKVNVDSVRSVRGIGKFVSRGRVRGQRSNWKKALVTLKKGQKLDLHEGV